MVLSLIPAVGSIVKTDNWGDLEGDFSFSPDVGAVVSFVSEFTHVCLRNTNSSSRTIDSDAICAADC